MHIFDEVARLFAGVYSDTSILTILVGPCILIFYYLLLSPTYRSSTSTYTALIRVLNLVLNLVRVTEYSIHRFTNKLTAVVVYSRSTKLNMYSILNI